jgi:8-oxo-dGTP diphosphatase
MVKINRFEFSPGFRFLQKAVIFYPTYKKFLAIKRSPTDFVRPDTWDLPGGHVEYPEEPKASLRREIKEETGLDVSELEPLHVISEYKEEKPVYYLWIVYKTKAMSEKIALSDEHSDYRWVTPEEFLQEESADFLEEIVKKISF